jgi:hypothetical protein
MPKSISEIARHFGVLEEEVGNWIQQGAPIELSDVDVAEIEAWRASQAWGEPAESDTGEGTEIYSADPSTEVATLRNRYAREDAECQKLKEEALKFRAEALRLYREASHLQLQWWQKPAIWFAILPIIFAGAGGVTWLVNALNEVKQASLVKKQLELADEINSLKAFKETFDKIKESRAHLTVKPGGNKLYFGFLDVADADKFELAAIFAQLSELQQQREQAEGLNSGSRSDGKDNFGRITEVLIDTDYYTLNPATFEEIAKLDSIESLVIEGNEIPLEGVEALRELRGLRSLDIRFKGAGGNLTREDTRRIGRIRQLEALKLERAGLHDDALAELTTLQILRTLELPGNQELAAGTPRHLSHLPYLQALNLSHTGAGPAMLDWLQRAFSDASPRTFGELRGVQLVGTEVTQEQVDALPESVPLVLLD